MSHEKPHIRHALIGVQHGRQGAGQTIPEDLALCVSCGWMSGSDYAEHLAAAAFRAGYTHARAEKDADGPLLVPDEHQTSRA